MKHETVLIQTKGKCLSFENGKLFRNFIEKFSIINFVKVFFFLEKSHKMQSLLTAMVGSIRVGLVNFVGELKVATGH